ncbi:glycerophosphodiester phosphodiesterase family protein [Enterococcus faecalis]|uniref:glycerophosphodiester phosphodiesterase family protein n=1 Tax=Enterococcus faecalis TaxID=1351 RepID=UPI0020911E75|nr:glycerophosphodiester phosphodiesterase family protein [Enterococcus faecalis]MCO5404425.1 glycerophosphodiester phosphodiesterase [Enterococcus faecalis]
MAVEHIQETDTLNRGREKINQAIDLANDSSTKVDQYGTELDQGIKDAKKIATDAGQAAKTTADTAAAEAKQTASTAATEATNIATVAGQEAKNIAETAGAEANKKADQAVADSKTAVESSNQAVGRANQNKQEFDALRNEFDDLVAESGDSNPEIVQARTDSQGVKQNTLQNRLSADFSSRLTNADAIKLFSGPVDVPKMMDLAGKVAGNTSANPHSVYTDYTATSLKKPSATWTEISQENYNKLVGRDDQGVSVGSSQGSVIPQLLDKSDTINAIEQLAPRIFEGMTLAEKVKYMKDNFISISLTIRAKASSPNNKNLKVALYLESTDTYTTKIQGDATEFTDFTVEVNDSNFIDSKGFINVLAYCDSSNGVTAANINVDYIGVQLKVSLNPLTVLNQAGFADEGDLALKTDLKEFKEYAAREDNPHNVTAEQVDAYTKGEADGIFATPADINKTAVGLDKVPNYPVATKNEAESGKAADKFMTPERVTQQVFTGFGQSFRDAPLYIAHRGNNYFYPENSLLAFRTVTRHWGIETDIQLTTDGKWYCFHDSTVDRMTNGTGKFMDKTSAQIEALRLDAGNGIAGLPDAFKKIPTFDQYLDECMKARKVPVIEITPLKTDFTSAQLDSIVTTIRNKGLENKVVIICFTLDILKQMRTRMPYTVMHYLVENDSTATYDACLEYNLVPSFSNTGNSLTAAVVNKYHAVNREVGMWVTQSVADHDRMKSLGFDYISVDQPSGHLRYEEPVLLSGFTQNNAANSGVTFVEEYAPGVIHIRINVRDGNNAVDTNIFKLPEWAIPRWSNTLVGQVRATKVASHTFVPASVDIWGYAALSDSTKVKQFGYVTVGTNWEQRATYATIDLVYNI